MLPPPVETGGYKMIDALPVIIWLWLRHYKFRKNIFGCCVNILCFNKNRCVPFIKNLFSEVETLPALFAGSYPHQFHRVCFPRIPLRHVKVFVLVHAYIVRVFEYFYGLLHPPQLAIFINRLNAAGCRHNSVVFIQN